MRNRRSTLRTLIGVVLAGGLGHCSAIVENWTKTTRGHFQNTRNKTKWNVDGPLLWGYFSLDPDESFAAHAAELEGESYRVVATLPVPGRQLFRLHVERIEIHSPSSLDKRNMEFYAFAERHSITSYDGMDVGPVPAK